MLFLSLGQGYVFLLILCLGLLFGMVEVVSSWAFSKTCALLKSHKTRLNNQPNHAANFDTNTPRRITFLSPQKNTTENDKKISKNTNKNKIVHGITKKYLKNISQFCIGLFRVCGYSFALYLVILFCDYGEIRAYHFVAFLIGFCLIKAIFAKLNKKSIQSATL